MDSAKESLLLLKNARKFAKKVKNSDWDTDLKIAVLGSCSIQYFVMVLRYMLYQEGIYADIYEGEYNGVAMEVLDSSSKLYQFQPNIVIILTHYMEIKQFPRLLEDVEETENLLQGTLRYYENIWRELERIPNCQVLQSNIVIPPEHTLGNLETKYVCSRTSFYQMLNKMLVERSLSSVTIVDLELLSGYIGKYQWFDYSSYFLTKSGFSYECIGEIVRLYVRQIKALRGEVRKCLVLDLDNTLWGGVIGDDGVLGVQLDPNHAVGEAYRYFQQYILTLKQRGVILAVCSKNEDAIAREAFLKNENMVLKLDDISCFVANWEDKASNLKHIALELDIGVDSLVFFDDNPAEREIIRQYLPEVHVIDVPKDPANYVLQLDREAPFEWTQITKEDILRNNSYVQNRERQKMAQQFVNYEEYLRALDMHGETGLLKEEDVGRFTQLLNKSNQFNLRTQRYTEAEIYNLILTSSHRCLYVKLKDKFSDYGLISCVILRKEAECCFIESWVMSCRVLKRNVEYLLFSKIVEQAQKMECNEISAEYIATAKNRMVQDFYELLGFSIIEKLDGVKRYRFNIKKEFEYQTFITIKN